RRPGSSLPPELAGLHGLVQLAVEVERHQLVVLARGHAEDFVARAVLRGAHEHEQAADAAAHAQAAATGIADGVLQPLVDAGQQATALLLEREHVVATAAPTALAGALGFVGDVAGFLPRLQLRDHLADDAAGHVAVRVERRALARDGVHAGRQDAL